MFLECVQGPCYKLLSMGQCEILLKCCKQAKARPHEIRIRPDQTRQGVNRAHLQTGSLCQLTEGLETKTALQTAGGRKEGGMDG